MAKDILVCIDSDIWVCVGVGENQRSTASSPNQVCSTMDILADRAAALEKHLSVSSIIVHLAW